MTKRSCSPRWMPPYRYLVALVLASTYMLNFIDRQLLAILAEPIRHELGLSDTQLGMLTGLTFALFYTFFGIPVAMVADRRNRIRLIAVACGVWTLREIGTTLSFGTAFAMVVATWAGAWVADRAAMRSPILLALLPAAAICLATPFLLGFTFTENWLLSSALLVPAVIFTSIYLVPALALLQNRTPAEARATVGAILLFLINLVGLGGGPVFVGALSDALSPVHGDGSLGVALRWLAPFALLACACHAGAAWLIHKERGGTR